MRIQPVTGPPGCGKTTYLKKRITHTATERGSENIVALSFTRAAAAELVGRDLPIPRQNVGTLHAFAYRAIGTPTVAQEHINQWNEEHPAYRLSAGGKLDLDDPLVEQTGRSAADVLAQDYDNYRARLVPRHLWNPSVVSFGETWQRWLEENDYIDFTGMIESAIEETDAIPGKPEVIWADEFQDMTPLEVKLVNHWAQAADYLGVALDPDQCIYSFKGSSPKSIEELDSEAMLDGEILAQSYRVPRAVHAAAVNWICKIQDRELNEYHPRDHDGRVRLEHNYRYRSPEMLVEDAADKAGEGKSVMILASCSYMLDPIKAIMRRYGIPFENKYQRKRGDWNPLAPPGKDRIGVVQRLISYLGPTLQGRAGNGELWTGEELKNWVSQIRSKELLARGAKKSVLGNSGMDFVDYQRIEQLFATPMTLIEAIDGLDDLKWFESALMSDVAKKMQFPMQVYRRLGIDGLTEQPRIQIGTVHSVKGGEAQVVYVIPDLSSAGMRQWTGGVDKDAIIRMFYVAMTRASEELVLCGESSGCSIEPQLMAPRELITS